MEKRILLITKKHIISEGVANRIAADHRLKIVYWATEEEMIQDAYESYAPNCLILCAAFFAPNTGLKIKDFILKNPNANILVVSGKIDHQFVDDVLGSGAKGIISPVISNLNRLIESIHSIADGSPANYRDSPTAILHNWGMRDNGNQLITDREKEIIKLIAESKSSKEIAKDLQITPATVDVHRRNIMKKLGVNKAAEITKYA